MSGEREKTDKLRSMFFTYLFDMSWKLAVSFLTPFFVGLLLSNGELMRVAIGFAVGILASIVVIVTEIKKINKAVRDEL